MIYFRNRNHAGFSFIEIVVTIALVGTVLVALFNVQTTVMQLLVRSSDRMRRVFSLHDHLYRALLSLPKNNVLPIIAAAKDQDDPSMAVSIKSKDPEEQSSLHGIDDLKLICAQAHWQRFGIAQEEDIITLLYCPAAKEKNS
jgi:prepilin-type N-terminal cleavage/methylation domain-containing protein